MNRFCVIGHPVAHSLSPEMHAANFAALGYAGEYSKFDVAPEDLGAFVRRLRDDGYLGMNVTVPHKRAVMEFLDRVDDTVSGYGACNTVKFERDGTLSGFNTDITGFHDCLSAHGCGIRGARVAILGCGGAGEALAKACLRSGAAAVFVAARTAESRRRLLASLRELAAACAAAPVLGELDTADAAAARECDLIVNATPIGLKETDASVLPAASFREGQVVLDIIPTRRTPPTAALAASRGATAIGGLEFLVGQGAKSFEIWTGLRADRAAMLKAVCKP